MMSDCFKQYKGVWRMSAVWCPMWWYIILSNHGRSEVEHWISLFKLILHFSKRHCFVLVATNYLTKWTEAVSLKDIIHSRGCIYSGLSHLYKMTWPIYDIVLGSNTWLVRRCFSLFKYIFGLGEMFLGTQALPRNRGAYVDTQNWHDSGFLDNLDRPVRPV